MYLFPFLFSFFLSFFLSFFWKKVTGMIITNWWLMFAIEFMSKIYENGVLREIDVCFKSYVYILCNCIVVLQWVLQVAYAPLLRYTLHKDLLSNILVVNVLNLLFGRHVFNPSNSLRIDSGSPVWTKFWHFSSLKYQSLHNVLWLTIRKNKNIPFFSNCLVVVIVEKFYQTSTNSQK